ncbi:MAG: 3-phosphoshikimate 1-carboxyvinyltransferase [Ekhidna sp.]|uniref:3-phosphoshikimate 1-carboxyvinyltransferase n=1 Tax=Ekhidna sp. TaxID=2608089 RepID=UPI0032EF859B
MKYRLKRYNSRLRGTISLESSKSESNRALLINALAGGQITDIGNLSGARDTQTMLRLLTENPETFDVKDAGTTMRFLTAYLALQEGEQVITGTDRMKKRPIGPLVDALREIGVPIAYLEKDGYPPMRIDTLKEQAADTISIPGNISSQYISALLMIAPCLPKGLTIHLTTEVYSKPYIRMTLDLMRRFGVDGKWKDNSISIGPQVYTPSTHTIEGDWSGASYWYSFMALSKQKGSLNLPGIWNYSSQGDNEIANIMYQMGVISYFEPGRVKLVKRDKKQEELILDFKNCPDLAQTVMVAAAASGITLRMTGLESLRIKETDRIYAMQTELARIGALLVEEGDQWILSTVGKLPSSVEIETYEDHRMAMAFAPLCQLMDVTIDDPMVVEKSYPGFWEEVKKLGVEVEEC